ncbi:hypothetical protein YC2023_033750 [Brassica napus]
MNSDNPPLETELGTELEDGTKSSKVVMNVQRREEGVLKHKELLKMRISVTLVENHLKLAMLPELNGVNPHGHKPSAISTTFSLAVTESHPQLFTKKLFAAEKYGVGVVIGKSEEARADSGQVDSVVISIQRLLFISPRRSVTSSRT